MTKKQREQVRAMQYEIKCLDKALGQLNEADYIVRSDYDWLYKQAEKFRAALKRRRGKLEKRIAEIEKK